jgi:ubiquinone/menaquinone biosynthesis C-methylase UbiE
MGRWTSYLTALCGESYIGVDLSAKCIDHCRCRFADCAKASFHTNDGSSLPMVEDGSVDLIFSFDSLVHVEADVIAPYVREFRRVLRPGGFGFIHHSNLGEYPWRVATYRWLQKVTPRAIWRSKYFDLAVQQVFSLNMGALRAPTVSAAQFTRMCEREGLAMVGQEMFAWRSGRCQIDCISVFTKPGGNGLAPSCRIESPFFGRGLRKHWQRMARMYSESTQTPCRT